MTTLEKMTAAASAIPSRDDAARAMLAALKEFRMYYPHGIDPNLDEAYAMAGDAIAQAEAAGIEVQS